MSSLKIAIAGSGTSGLAAAAFLARDGHNVTVFERFADPQPLGAGLLLQPTGLACLARLGLDGRVLEWGAKIAHLHGQAANGRTIFDIRYGDLSPHLFGLGIHRGALFFILYDEARRLGVRIVTSCDIARSVVKGNARIIFDQKGQEYGPFDLVIDASGARSALRGENDGLKYNKAYPYGAVWGVCEDAEQSFGGNHLRQRYDGASVMIGALAIGKRPADGRKTLAFFWSLPVKTYQAWRDASLEPWKARVRHYWPEMSPFIDQFRSVDDLTFAQYSDTIMRRWHGERMVFIGDAAHSTSPQLGQGANLGLIDALTLSECLKETKDISDGLARYSKLRRNHLYFYQLASRWLTPFFQSDSRGAAWVRDRSFGLLCKTPYVRTEMLRTLAGIKTGLFTHLNPGAWHPNYDLRKSQPR